MPKPDPDSRPTDPDLHFCGFQSLMPHRVQSVLLVSSLYESFILEEEGMLTELITSEYLDLNLSHAPRVSRASTGEEALEFIQTQDVDLVIAMPRLGQWNLIDFARAVKQIRSDLPLVVLAADERELPRHSGLSQHECIDRIFVWRGDAKILLAIVKFVEDQLNAEHDARTGDVRIIILVENSVRFYSAYLPLIYAELVKLTHSLMAEGINPMNRLLRMRARPKILLAETFEEAWTLYSRFGDNLLGVISDIRFPRNGELDDTAGLDFVRLIRKDSPHLPVLLQSSDGSYVSAARELRASFLNKTSRTLLEELKGFILGRLGFGDFVFMLPDGQEVGRCHDLRTFEELLATIPDDSLVFHAQNNHFSNWLMARTEFEMAARIRPRKVTDFATVAELRAYLQETLAEFRERSQSGVIVDFSSARLDVPTAFKRIGGGSIGGKARGLAFMNALCRRYSLRDRFEGVCVSVPASAAVGTDVFDAFLDGNGLRDLISQEPDDEEASRVFLEAKLPPEIYSDLAAFLRRVRYPLAVRSSSLLEDSHGRPFAGVYTTHMIPNNHPDLNIRLDQLCDAIKLVYASTFFRSARRYMEVAGRHAEEEKMGVILQEVVGSRHDERFYPTFAGVARSYNFYPAGEMKPEDGVASVVLGLGKMVVEGGQSLLFCPSLPNVLPQFSSTKDMLATSQRQFYALDISHPEVYPSPEADANLLLSGLEVAEADGTLAPIGSVYSPENDMVYDGVFRDGPRLVTFAHVLKSGMFPLADVLRFLLDIGVTGMACPIEIEFAVDMSTKPIEFGILQIRPIITHEEFEDVSLEKVDLDEAICYSARALGNGQIRDVRDIVYVRPDTFDAAQTREMAASVARINDELARAGRHCVLVGPGRWGSSDRWLGIPVTWDQISSARVIVETTLRDFIVTPSQGAHFFQNMTSLGIGYFTVDPSVDESFINWDWLAKQRAVEETEFIRHVRFSEPLEVRLDGRSRRGVVLKPSE
ncbi:MAG: histidine kinase [Planctomycetes bacterium]|nr:histidine kinase [Planctomycetota bacterium]